MPMTLIATGNVASVTNTLTISNVPNTYTHLWFMISARTTRNTGSNAGYAEIAFNGSVTASYYRGFSVETQNTNNAWANTGGSPMIYSLGTEAAGNTGFSQVEVFFDYYNSGFNRTAWAIGASSLGDFGTNPSDAGVKYWRGAGYDNTQTPSSFTITQPFGHNFSVGSIFSLYGIS